MAATRFRSFIIGDTLTFDLQVYASPGVPENLEGKTIWTSCKTNLTDPDAQAKWLLSFAVPNGAAAQAGQYQLKIPSDKTRVPAGKYWFDIQRTIPGTPPDVWTLYREEVEAVADVTQDDTP